MATTITTILSVLTIVGDVLIALYLFESLGLSLGMLESRSGIFMFIKRHAKVLAFLVALTAMLGSLYYSEVLGYEPCELCWYQRIFMYSQVFVFATALVKRDGNVWRYSLPLSIIGGLIAAFHYYIQTVPKPLITIPCTAVGNYSASCSKVFVLTYGYITIPVMALSAFLLIIIASLLSKTEKKTQANLPPHQR